MAEVVRVAEGPHRPTYWLAATYIPTVLRAAEQTDRQAADVYCILLQLSHGLTKTHTHTTIVINSAYALGG